MASLNTDKAGNRTIQFVGTDGKRRSIRLGKVNKKLAESVKLKVEHLAAALAAKMPLDGETAAWVASIGDDLAGKLAAVGLVPKRESQAIGAFLDAYGAARGDESKPTTVINIRRVASDLAAFFGAGTDLKGVTPARADDFRRHYLAQKLAPATVARRLKVARMLFKHALARGLVGTNPFAEVKGPSAGPNPDRQVYVSRGDVRQVIAVCSPEWQVIVALSRFAGLRAPSEVFSLRWESVELAGGRMVVHSPKTERHPGGGSRVVPIFPDLRPYLEAAHGRAEGTGAVYVVNGVGERGRQKAAGKSGWNGCNLSVPFDKMVERAGLVPWPKSMHNMRASCETDLMRSHPIHVVCAWLGNTPNVALGHYLQTLDSDFAKALGGTGGGGAECGAECGAVSSGR